MIRMKKNKETLQADLNILKEEYIKLLNDKDVLDNWGKPQLAALYATRIGYLQVEKLQLQLRIKGQKRKIEMVQSAINRNVPVDIMAIELLVATELAEAEYRIMQETGKIENARNLLSNLSSPERSSELRKLYRQMAKQLHADINPGLTEEQQQIWLQLKDAYQAGDLEKLKAMELIYENQLKAASAAQQELTEEELLLKIEVLKEGCVVLNEQIKQIKSEFPFTIELQIKDEVWVAEEQDKLKKEITALNLYETELTLQYQQIIGAL